eukprot:4431224-Prymnesium_polylepis.1
MRSENAALRESNSKDLGILLQQQLQLASKVASLDASVRELDAPGAHAPTMAEQQGLASAIAATADESRELQLALLEKRNEALRAEVASLGTASAA